MRRLAVFIGCLLIAVVVYSQYGCPTCPQPSYGTPIYSVPSCQPSTYPPGYGAPMSVQPNYSRPAAPSAYAAPARSQAPPLVPQAVLPVTPGAPPLVPAASVPNVTPKQLDPPATNTPKPNHTIEQCQCPCHQDVRGRLDKIDQLLTQIGDKVQNTGDIGKIATDIQQIKDNIGNLPASADLTKIQEAQAKILEILEKLAAVESSAAALTKIQASLDDLATKVGKPAEVTLTLGSPPNLPASYVDTSTVWAIQASTGIDHMVLLANSSEATYSQLQSEHKRVYDTFPAFQFVDVVGKNLKISPTPQLVVYFTASLGKQPEVVVGADAVAKRLRELFK